MSTPVEIDTRIAEVSYELAKTERELEIQEMYQEHASRSFSEEQYANALAKMDALRDELSVLQAQYARERYDAEQRAERKAERQAKKDQKAIRAYERALKLLAKVEAAYGALGGVEAVRAMPERGEGSLYYTVYRQGEPGVKQMFQDSVIDVLLADDRERREGKRASYDPDPRRLIKEFEESDAYFTYEDKPVEIGGE